MADFRYYTYPASTGTYYRDELYNPVTRWLDYRDEQVRIDRRQQRLTWFTPRKSKYKPTLPVDRVAMRFNKPLTVHRFPVGGPKK